MVMFMVVEARIDNGVVVAVVTTDEVEAVATTTVTMVGMVNVAMMVEMEVLITDVVVAATTKVVM